MVCVVKESKLERIQISSGLCGERKQIGKDTDIQWNKLHGIDVFST